MRFHSHELELQVDVDHRDTSAGQAPAFFCWSLAPDTDSDWYKFNLNGVWSGLRPEDLQCLQCQWSETSRWLSVYLFPPAHGLVRHCASSGFPSAEFQWRWGLTKLHGHFQRCGCICIRPPYENNCATVRGRRFTHGIALCECCPLQWDTWRRSEKSGDSLTLFLPPVWNDMSDMYMKNYICII